MKKIETELDNRSSDVDMRNIEVITALASDYTSLFYLNLKTEEVFMYSMNASVASKYEAYFTTCNFEEAKKAYAERDIYPDDREEYYKNLKTSYIRKRLRKENSYSLVYRMIVGEGCEYCEVKIIRIMEGDSPKAAVVAYSNVDKRVRNDQERMEQLQTALHHAETDNLTGLLNRGGGEIKARRLIDSEASGLFVLFDIDGFKGINDRYGHQTGDAALEKVAAAIKTSMRSDDLCIRFGGDEFVICVEGITERNLADEIIGRLFREISSIGIEGMPAPITISVGATLFPASEGDNFESIYSRVDKAMYKAKKTPNNSVIFCC